MHLACCSLEAVLLGTAVSLGPSAAMAAGDARTIDVAAVEAFVAQQVREGGYPSLSVGVVRGQELVFARAYGVADRESGREATTESLYRIGSITKVFTTTLMCLLRDEGVVRLDDAVSKYLPDSVRLPSDPRGAPEITLRHLATHSSGLPRQPPNLLPKDEDVYGGYTVAQLYEGLPQVALAYPTGSKYQYSNLGMGLLGHILEKAAGRPYEELLTERLLAPLGMIRTGIALSKERQAALTTGYRGEGLKEPAPVWDLGCLAPAGALVSSVPDLAKFLALQMRAGQADVQPVSGSTLTELHTPQRLTEGWQGGVGLGWHVNPAEGIGDVVWHNGGVAGHFAFIGFVQERKLGVIVLTNADKPVDGVAWALLALAAESQKAGPTTATADALPSGAEIHDDYREVDGILYPHRFTQKVGGITTVMIVESLRHNQDIPEDRFRLPPEVKKLLDQSRSPGTHPAGP